MEELIKILKIGYFQAIKDIFESKKIKKYNISLNNEIKSKIYDIGYKQGYNDYVKYCKNNI